MSDKLEVSILTPDSSSSSYSASMVVLQSDEGELGILPHHISMIAVLKPGVIKIFDSSKVIFEAFIFGGYLEVSENKLYVMANKLRKASELNVTESKNKIADIEKAIFSSDDVEQNQKFFREIEVHRRIIDLVK